MKRRAQRLEIGEVAMKRDGEANLLFLYMLRWYLLSSVYIWSTSAQRRNASLISVHPHAVNSKNRWDI